MRLFDLNGELYESVPLTPSLAAHVICCFIKEPENEEVALAPYPAYRRKATGKKLTSKHFQEILVKFELVQKKKNLASAG